MHHYDSERRVTRLEVIDDSGRAYTNLNVKPGSLYYDLQDDGRTLKIFCTGVQAGQVPLHNVQNDNDTKA